MEAKRDNEPRSFPIAFRMGVLVATTLLGLTTCFAYARQLKAIVGPRLGAGWMGSDIHVVQQATCPSLNGSDSSYLHYPKPETFSRGECDCNPVRYFAILSMQRSGSGWFETFLNSHTNISSNGEIFSVKDRRSNVSSIINTLDKVYNLDWFSSASKNECSAAVGFKWMLNQGLLKFHEEIEEYFSRRGVSAVFLLRRNLLQRMISILANAYDSSVKQINGTHKSHVHSEKEAEMLARYKPAINISTLIQDLKRAEDMASKGLEYFKSSRHIILYYEDLVNNRTKLLDVQDFLGVPRRTLISRQVKIHKKPMAEQIDNWKEVYKTLNGTKYKRYLETTRRRHLR